MLGQWSTDEKGVTAEQGRFSLRGSQGEYEIKAADWTAPRICAHQSVLKDRERVDLPDFRE